MKLQKLSDFVLEQGMNPMQDDTKCWRITHNYATFLKQPLELWMFVPCDENGKVLEKPNNYHLWLNPNHAVYNENRRWLDKCEQYQQAEQRVLFDLTEYPMKLHEIKLYCSSKFSVESLLTFYICPTLTETAIKQKYNK